ncbi:MAG: C40 family peptidase [Gorillibacterium sp.]|nr:C40 family peptidase [Gorillibacterium sp.]
MNTFIKAVLLSSVVFLSMSLNVSHAQAAESRTVKVQVNDELVHFPDAQPFVDKSSRTQIPLRFVSEKMGYSIRSVPVGNHVKITIQNDNNKVVLQTGQNRALVNGKIVTFDTKAIVKKGRTYVPIRFIAESLKTEVKWDSKINLAIVKSDDKNQKPLLFNKRVNPTVAPTNNKSAVVQINNNGLKDDVIGNAKKFMGVSYKWGGTTPKGFDCSGFVQFVYNMQSVTLPRTSNAMLSSSGLTVFKPEVGDLVFFSSSKKAPATHVGIYVGNGKFISATSSRGVRVDSLTDGYWGNRYFAVKRVL